MKYLITVGVILLQLFALTATGQTNVETGTEINLDEYSPNTGNYRYEASKTVILHPSYNFKADGISEMHALINPSIEDDPNYQGENNYTEQEWGQGINQSLPVGTTNGDLNIGNGTVNYSIPFHIPEGINGLTPSIGIAYNSLFGRDILGYGWYLNGLSSISRATKNYYYDNKVAPVDGNNYSLSLDGQRLISIENDANGYGVEFITSSNSFSSISRENNDSFIVKEKDGTTYYYGTTSNSKLTNTASSLTTQWLLKKTADLHGNYIEYTYQNVDNEILVQAIKYGNETVAGSENWIRFFYNTRADKDFQYIAGLRYNKNALLERVEIEKGNNLYRKYNFEYFIRNGISYLKSVTEVLPNLIELNPTRFLYGESSKASSIAFDKDGIFPEKPSDENRNTPQYEYHTGDFNGDGLTDFLALEWIDEGFGGNDVRYVSWGIFYNSETNEYNYQSLPWGTYEQELIGMSGVNRNTSQFEVDNSEFIVPGFKLHIGDLNADGKDDIVYGSSSNQNHYNFAYSCVYSSPTGYKTTNKKLVGVAGYPSSHLNEKTIKHSAVIADFDGDGYSEFLTVNAGNFYCQISNFGLGKAELDATTYFGPTFTGAAFNAQQQLVPTDYDGDGAFELLYRYLDDDASNTTVLTFVDVDIDVIQNTFSVKAIGKRLNQYNFMPSKSRKFNSTANLFANNDADPNPTFNSYDFNGDNLNDIILYGSNGKGVFLISKGSVADEEFTYDSYEEIEVTGNEKYFPLENERYNAYFDVNNDGLTDIIYHKPSTQYIEGATYTLINTGGLNFFSTKVGFTLVDTFYKKCLIGDYNGDGTLDLCSTSKRNLDPLRSNIGTATFTRINYSFSLDERLLKEVKDGFGRNIALSYTTLTGTKATFKNRVYPLANINVGFEVVESVTSSEDGITKYKYEGPIYNYEKKSFEGFEKISTEHQNSSTQTIRFASYNSVHQRMFTDKVEAYNLNTNQLVSKTKYTNYIGYTYGLNSKSKFIYPEQVKTTLYDPVDGLLLTTSTNTNAYSQEGNLISQTTNNTIREVTTTYSDFIPVYTGLTPSLPQKVQTRSFDLETTEKSFTRTKLRYKAGKGQVEERITFCDKDWNTTELSLITNYTYEPVAGLVTSVTNSVLDDDIPARTNTTSYTSDYRYKKTGTNALGQTITYSDFDIYGNPRSIIDYNNLETINTYDNLGRVLTVKTPSGVKSHKSYNWALSKAGAPEKTLYSETSYVEGSNGGTLPPVTIYYNKLGQDVYALSANFDNTENVAVGKKYNNLHQLEWVTLPYKEGSYANEKSFNEYDELTNRLQATHLPYDYSKLQEYTYAGLTQGVSNNWGITGKNTTLNIAGETASIIDDFENEIKYKYYSHGGIKSIIAGGKTIEFEYDSAFHQVLMNDPDAGEVNYTYNAFGELTFQKDHKGNVTTIEEIDNLGRVLKQKQTDEVGLNASVYIKEYDTAPNGIGRLHKATGPNNHTIEYTYDTYSRLESKKETVMGNVYTTSYTYDEFDRIQTINHPSTLVEEISYHKAGQVKQRKVDGQIYWEGLEYDIKGRLIEEKKQGVLTTYAYKNGFLKSQRTPGYHNRSYEFQTGSNNILSRTDSLYGFIERFSYDKLDRLTNVTSQNLNAAILNPTTISETRYDDQGLGNIAYKNGVGSYMYNESDEAVHRVSGIKDLESIVPPPNQNITYTTFNSIKTIVQDNFTLQLTYGFDQQRLKTVLKDDNGDVKTKLFLNGYEATLNHENGTQQIIQQLGGGVVAVKNILNGINTPWIFFNIYTDYQGSIETVVNPSLEEGEQVIYEQRFDAWGKRLNPQTGLSYLQFETPLALFADRGYTGHEHLEEFKLINMNGRVYDPMLGMMLSPDNFVQDATNFQNFNRYSYVLNNPTKYTDPSGEVIRGGGPLPAHQGYSMYTESPVVSYDGFVISGMEAGSFLESLSRGGGAAHGLGVISNGNITHTRENKSAIASLNPTAFMDFLYPNGFMNNSKNIFNKLYNRFYTNEILDNNAQIPYRLGTEIVREKVEKNENEQSGGNPSLGSQIVNNVLTGAGAFSATMEASYASDAQYIYRYAQGSQSATQITQANKVLSNRIAGGFQVAGQAIAVLSLSHSAIQSYNGNARNGSFVYDVINTGIGFIPFVGVPTSILGAVYKDDILDYGNSHPYHGNAHTRCFVAGTPVYSNDGFVNIELLKVNDTLSSYNVATGVVELMQVSHTSNRITTNVYQVVTNLDTFIVTGEHPFYVEGRNWTEVKDLKAGDELRSLLNTKISVIKIEKLEVEKTVYNIEVNGNHNFYVGQGKVLVHNKTRNEKHISTEELNKKILIQKDILDETRNKK